MQGRAKQKRSLIYDKEAKYQKLAQTKFKRLPGNLRNDKILKMIKPIPRTPGTMNLNEYQTEAAQFVAFPDSWTITYPALGLSSEAGEVCDKIKKAIRDRKTLSIADLHHELAPELGDVLWYIAILAQNLGLELEDVARMNIEKLKSRKERGKIGGSGDDR